MRDLAHFTALMQVMKTVQAMRQHSFHCTYPLPTSRDTCIGIQSSHRMSIA